ncbi:MAG TPA: glycosyltransferase [Solirubrobacterales bacterium]|nr:glycosyltransferase [Solirubrobacterales bacterium]
MRKQHVPVGPLMRVGIVTKWFASGQAVVSRYVRSALEELGHETFILAREGTGPRSGVERVPDPIWDQPGVTETGESDVAIQTYREWVSSNSIDVVMTDNLYQFDEMAALRADGVKTVGRFVWEHFEESHVEGAKAAFDIVFSLHRGEQARYATMGIDSPYVVWGCHPELIAVKPNRPDDGLVRLLVPGSFMGRRKPLEEMLEAFMQTKDERLRLIIKGQTSRKEGKLAKAAGADSRIEILIEDQPTDEHLSFVAGCDVCFSPTRWEGLGLPLYEAIAFGQPAITNDNAPMNEAVLDGVNGYLVGASVEGTARSGITSWSPHPGELAAAIERIADDGARSELAAGARELREGDRAWARTVEGYGALLSSL